MELENVFSIAENTLNFILEKFYEKAFEKIAIGTAKMEVAKEMQKTELMSIEQINFQSLNCSKLQIVEEEAVPSKIKEFVRPYSATVKQAGKQSTASSQQILGQSKHSINRNSRYSQSKTGRWKMKHKDSTRKSKGSIYSTRSVMAHFCEAEKQKFIALGTKKQLDEPIVQQLRKKKIIEEQEQKKKQLFFETIKTDAKNFSKNQSKFLSQYAQKKFIYTYQGDILEIPKKRTNLKRGITSRIVFQQESTTKSRPQTAQEIVVGCRASEQKTPTNRKTQILEFEDQLEQLFKTSAATKIKILR